MPLGRLYLGAVSLVLAVLIRIAPTTVPYGTAVSVGLALLGILMVVSSIKYVLEAVVSLGRDGKILGRTDTGDEPDEPTGDRRTWLPRDGTGLPRRRVLKSMSSLPALVAGLGAAWAGIASVVYPPTYVWRVLAWRESDVDDYLNRFPQRELAAPTTSAPFDEELDEQQVVKVFESAVDTDDFEAFLSATDTQAFIVIHEGQIRYESYFDGWQRDSMVTSFSVAKSVTSTLVGIAHEEGHIDDLDDSITKYLPELLDRDPGFANITIRHLLTMSSGLDYQAFRWFLFNGDDPLTTYHPDQRSISLQKTTIVNPAGSYFRYNKYHPQLLGMLIERTTGMSVTEWTRTRLWEPLGTEFDGAWCLDSADSGFEKMEAGLNARAIDFAKLGQLFLDDGKLDGERIIAADWVELASGANRAGRAPTDWNDSYYDDAPTEWNEAYYAFMWWGFDRDDGPPDFSAIGDHGQFIYVSPVNDVVIVRNGVEWGIDFDEWTRTFYRAAGTFGD